MRKKITKELILSERMKRQGISDPVSTEEAYAQLFRNLQPVSPTANSRPGSPPCLEHRATFNDRRLTDTWRSDRKIIKGRFQRGLLGYIFQDDLDMYANAFVKPLKEYTEHQFAVLECVRDLEPVTKGIIKEETGLLMKHVSPALTRLQEAFLVYEDQCDDDWERGWEFFEYTWPDVDIADDKRQAARKTVLLHFLAAHVFATPQQLRDWSGFPLKEIRMIFKDLEKDGIVGWRKVASLGEGWLINTAGESQEVSPWRGAIVLSKADLLYRSHQSELKQQFSGLEVLSHLLIDGEFKGAVVGHWRIGPYDIDDIIVMMPEQEKQARKQEILTAVRDIYPPSRHNVLRYAGEKCQGRTVFPSPF
jgi:hypothetical protein